MRTEPWQPLPTRDCRHGSAAPRSRSAVLPSHRHRDRRRIPDARDDQRPGSSRFAAADADRSAAHLLQETAAPAPHTTYSREQEQSSEFQFAWLSSKTFESGASARDVASNVSTTLTLWDCGRLPRRRYLLDALDGFLQCCRR